jgi:Cu/Ag efflux protein CusF
MAKAQSFRSSRNPLCITLTACLVLAASSHSGCSRAPEPPAKQYPMTGQVLRLDARNEVALIRHDTIDGWMEAMTMEFPVKPKPEFEKLKTGDLVAGTVFVREYYTFWLTDVRVTGNAPIEGEPPPSPPPARN